MTNDHWYPHYTGDYNKKTSQLTLVQHGAYRVLLDHYYSTKQPLPANAHQLHRICRAFAQDEHDAIAYVLQNFFNLKGDLWHNERADIEIAKQKAISKARSKAAKNKDKPIPAIAEQMHSNCTAIVDTITVTATNTLTTTATQPVSSTTETDFQRVFDHGAALLRDLEVKDTSPIRQWLDGGCSVDWDILPTITRLARNKPMAWSYFTNAIMDAKATRERPLPAGTPKASYKAAAPKLKNVTTIF